MLENSTVQNGELAELRDFVYLLIIREPKSFVQGQCTQLWAQGKDADASGNRNA